MNILTQFNTLRPRQNGCHFADDIFKCIFLNENIWILIKISLKFVHQGQINNIPSLVQIMAWRRPGDKPLSEPMMVSLLTHICVTRPQWVNGSKTLQDFCPRSRSIHCYLHATHSLFSFVYKLLETRVHFHYFRNHVITSWNVMQKT